ncbi:hypothetical protein EYC80_001007 [Monilinia laxa]|uniref:Uncharacterized protein n=1 Tax=Monilinia laxa TaxID=61186 RepID=A0A5N6K7Z7_MONLA|nr:hypothetical protein EYC80_001007 [Monilinia laxa]
MSSFNATPRAIFHYNSPRQPCQLNPHPTPASYITHTKYIIHPTPTRHTHPPSTHKSQNQIKCVHIISMSNLQFLPSMLTFLMPYETSPDQADIFTCLKPCLSHVLILYVPPPFC